MNTPKRIHNRAFMFGPVETRKDISELRGRMIKGNYPASMTDCEVVGINGDCGSCCPILLVDDCPRLDEMLEAYWDNPAKKPLDIHP